MQFYMHIVGPLPSQIARKIRESHKESYLPGPGKTEAPCTFVWSPTEETRTQICNLLDQSDDEVPAYGYEASILSEAAKIRHQRGRCPFSIC